MTTMAISKSLKEAKHSLQEEYNLLIISNICNKLEKNLHRKVIGSQMLLLLQELNDNLVVKTICLYLIHATIY